LTLLAELAQIEGEDDFPPLGQVQPEWAETRVVASAFHHGSYADVYSSDWIGILRQTLAGFCLALGIPELDAGALQQPTSRPLTQRVSRVVFNNGFDGIHYHSRFGHDVRNWALFEPFKIGPQQAAPIDPGDPDLQAALAIHMPLSIAGFYDVKRPNGRHELVAVNTDRHESDLDMISSDTLALWRNTAHGRQDAVSGGKRRAQANGVWWYVLIAVLALAESLLGNRHLTAVDSEAN
jgi:hypothetical protein